MHILTWTSQYVFDCVHARLLSKVVRRKMCSHPFFTVPLQVKSNKLRVNRWQTLPEYRSAGHEPRPNASCTASHWWWEYIIPECWEINTSKHQCQAWPGPFSIGHRACPHGLTSWTAFLWEHYIYIYESIYRTALQKVRQVRATSIKLVGQTHRGALTPTVSLEYRKSRTSLSDAVELPQHKCRTGSN